MDTYIDTEVDYLCALGNVQTGALLRTLIATRFLRDSKRKRSYADSQVTRSNRPESVLASAVVVAGEVDTNISSGADIFVEALILIDARAIEGLDVSLGAFAVVASQCFHTFQLHVLGAVVQLWRLTLFDV